jgi:hypothetical protein
MTMNHRIPNYTEDQVDSLLTTYFHAQRPQTWPNAPQPWASTAITPTVSRSTTNTMLKSRLALAASVALLLGGCWYLSGQVTNGKKPTGLNLNNGDANTKHVKDLTKQPKDK